MEELTNKEIQKKRMLSYFIEAAQQIIDEEGIQSISIRKVGKKAGYNSATIYNYFKDIDQLVLLASMKYLRDYTVALARNIKDQDDPYQNFISIWEFFCVASYERPNIFYNLFFNKHSDRLDEVVTLYYSIYPNEAENYASVVEKMFQGRNILERNRIILVPLIQAGYLRQEDLETANEIMICCYRDSLEQRRAGVSAELLKGKMLDVVRFVIEKSRARLGTL